MRGPRGIFWADLTPCSTHQAGVGLHIWRPEDAGRENGSRKGATKPWTAGSLCPPPPVYFVRRITKEIYRGGCTNDFAARRRRLGVRADTLVLQTAAALHGCGLALNVRVILTYPCIFCIYNH